MTAKNFAEAFRFAVSAFLADMSELSGIDMGMETELMKKQGGPTVKVRDLVDAFIETESEGSVTIDGKELSFTQSVSHRCHDIPVSVPKDGMGPGFYVVQFREIAKSLGVDEAKASRGAKQLASNKAAKALTAAQLIELRKKAAAKASAKYTTEETASE